MSIRKARRGDWDVIALLNNAAQVSHFDRTDRITSLNFIQQETIESEMKEIDCSDEYFRRIKSNQMKMGFKVTVSRDDLWLI